MKFAAAVTISMFAIVVLGIVGTGVLIGVLL